MSIKPTAKLKIVLMADDTVVAELEDSDLWRTIISKQSAPKNTPAQLALKMVKQWARTAVLSEVEASLVERILTLVCETYEVPVDALRGTGRSPRLTTPRMVAMWLLRQHTGLSYPAIGSLFGRHHSTAMAACERLDELKKDEQHPIVREAQNLHLRMQVLQ